jgi:predicted HTH domain antitoxin
VEERGNTREILRRKSDLRKLDIAKIQSGNVSYNHAATGEL